MDIKAIAKEYLQDPTKITDEHYKTALDFVNEQCAKQNVCIEDFMKNKNNIPGVAKSIHSQLNFALRMLVKENTIKEVIEENYQFILTKFEEITSQNQAPAKEVAKAKKKG